MALPLTRDETLVAGAQVKSALLNNLQDATVGGKHGSIVRVIPAADAAEQFSATPPTVGTDFYLNANGDRAGRTGKVVFGIPLLVGERVTAITVYAKDVDGTHKFKGQLFERNMVTSARTSKSDLTLSAGSGLDQALALTTVVATTLAAGRRLEVDVTIDAGATSDYLIYGIAVTYEST